MKAIQMSSFGGAEVLKYVDVEEPVPNENEVRVKIVLMPVSIQPKRISGKEDMPFSNLSYRIYPVLMVQV